MASIKDLFRSAFKPKDRLEDDPVTERPVFSSESGAGAPRQPRAGQETTNEAPGEKPEDHPKRDGNDGAQNEPSEPENPSEQPSPEEGPEDDGLDSSFSDFYDRLYNALRGYGITSIPAFDELYGLLESFLRPAIDAAIEARNRAGRQNMAELDADAYARGMGGSSYLSSVKGRELDAVQSDVAALEGKYSASMGEYLYKALSAMQDMEAALKKAQLSASGRYGSGGRSSTGASSGSSDEPDARVNAELGYVPYGHTKNGAYFDGVWYDGDFSYLEKDYSYGDYVRYLRTLSASERYLFFTSDRKEWRIKRWQVQYNLPQVDYLDLVAMFMPDGAPGGNNGGSGRGGEAWKNLLY